MVFSQAKRKFLIGLLFGWISLLLLGKVVLYQNVLQVAVSNPSFDKRQVNFNEENSLEMKNQNKENIASSSVAGPSKCGSSSQDGAQSSEFFSADELMEATQSARKFAITTACQKYFPETSSLRKFEKSQYIHQYSLVSRKYKVIVCDIYKCGFTSWLSAIYVMEDIYTVKDFFNKKIHGAAVIQQADKKIRLVGMKDPTLKRKLWEESVKVITVRNPFSRLVSAYYNKMLTSSPGYTKLYEGISKRINKEFRHLRHNSTERDEIDDGNATFEDFVNFLLTIDTSKCDPHFRSYLAQCKPCDAQYDYVIKFETMKNDMEYLKQKLNVSDYHRQAVFPSKNFLTSMDTTEETFRNIPKSLALKLYEKYQKDFEIFGYEKPEWLY